MSDQDQDQVSLQDVVTPREEGADEEVASGDQPVVAEPEVEDQQQPKEPEVSEEPPKEAQVVEEQEKSEQQKPEEPEVPEEKPKEAQVVEEQQKPKEAEKEEEEQRSKPKPPMTRLDSKFFVSPSARDFAKEVASSIAQLSNDWSDETKGPLSVRREGFIDALQSLHVSSFSRQLYQDICKDCEVKNTDPVQELLKLAKGIQAQIPISQKQAPLMEMSLKLIQESPIRNVRILTARERCITAGRLPSNSLVIPVDLQSISRVQLIGLSVQTKMGGMFMIIDPGSVGGMTVLKRENLETENVVDVSGASPLTKEGGIIFVTEIEKVTLRLGQGRKDKGKVVEAVIQAATPEEEFVEEKEEAEEDEKEESEPLLKSTEGSSSFWETYPAQKLLTTMLILGVVCVVFW
eukprot:CAMPEP_0201488822 /NCGR_PEP_ID=MMETSP0151_2-20130828/19589_1 /ASSEMBLY_ACC=CAM_ASM_000257 /TAXON_ID=200890 /ORGANISM="Paramoeba atlantica, Strain 621/1 / CCAP 1560/9" /LENGTH=404 /DNA_ID=CAMNT_0047874191 /DNA_START=47 /DNA_END=1258 /DNA_ORIENTATION=+